MRDVTPSESGSGQRTTAARRRLVPNLALYTGARLVLVVALTAVIILAARPVGVEVPLVVAVLLALIIAMPLSLTLFKGLRTRVNEDIAVIDERRRSDKARLRAQLRGVDPQIPPDEPTSP
ncbi:DUF4229 domain-containing protein [Nocardia sp. CNY236]|uniref:DUF4229 domain-containing protein n=1 Tax=Nocardia sp. CNY236 TaxID=1169152 RepID=UPI00041CE65E|nr:DUF4229 domain-containing protein [Nocardia sp. CNY236]